MVEISLINPTLLFTSKIALLEMLLEKQSNKQITVNDLHNCKGNKADQRSTQTTAGVTATSIGTEFPSVGSHKTTAQ